MSTNSDLKPFGSHLYRKEVKTLFFHFYYVGPFHCTNFYELNTILANTCITFLLQPTCEFRVLQQTTAAIYYYRFIFCLLFLQNFIFCVHVNPNKASSKYCCYCRTLILQLLLFAFHYFIYVCSLFKRESILNFSNTSQLVLLLNRFAYFLLSK